MQYKVKTQHNKKLLNNYSQNLSIYKCLRNTFTKLLVLSVDKLLTDVNNFGKTIILRWPGYCIDLHRKVR